MVGRILVFMWSFGVLHKPKDSTFGAPRRDSSNFAFWDLVGCCGIYQEIQGS